MKEAQGEKIDLQTGTGSVIIPNAKGDPMECKITSAYEQVDEKSIHVITDRGVFLVSIDECTIDGKEMTDIEELKLNIPEKKQTNPN